MRTPKELPPGVRARPFSRVDALRLGLDDNRLRRSDLVAPFRGVRVESGAELTSILQLCIAYAPRLRPGQFFSHRSAAVLWNLPLTNRRGAPLRLDVAACAGDAWPPAARRVRGHILSGDSLVVTERHGLPVCDVVSTWLQLGADLDLDELVTVGDAVVFAPRYPKAGDVRPYASVSESRAALFELRQRGKRRLVEAVTLVREGVESPMETQLRLLLMRAGLPEPEVNVDIVDGPGRFVGRVDLYYREYGVAVEYDGEHHREDRVVYAADQRRIARLMNTGITVVRVRVDGLRSESPQTLADVRHALAAAGWPRQTLAEP